VTGQLKLPSLADLISQKAQILQVWCCLPLGFKVDTHKVEGCMCVST
jgi:hypothetical protein